MTKSSRTVRACTALFSALLRMAPAGTRRDIGRAMSDDVELLLTEARAKGRRAVLWMTAMSCMDLVARLPAEWSSAGQRENNTHTDSGEWVMNGMRELKRAARTLARRPGFAAVAALTLALGIGANIAIFSIVDAVLLQPLPYDESEQIVSFTHHAPGLDLPELNNSEGILALYADRADVFEATAAFRTSTFNLTGGDEAARVDVVTISPELFEVLRVQPMLGRPFNAADPLPEGPQVGILAHDSWRSRFGSDPAVLGRTIELDGNTIEIVGVMPESFRFPEPGVEVYTPMYVNPDGPFGSFGLEAISRLSPGVTPEAAEARLNEVMTLIPERFPGMDEGFVESAGFNATVRTLRDRMVVDVESVLWIILGTVGFVLLIACANVANLFLVRAESRQKEMAVRAAMGAGRRSVAATFLAESLVLGIAGGVLGVLFAVGSVGPLLALADLPRADEVTIGISSLALAATLSVVAGLIFGSIPMLRYAGDRGSAVLRDGSRGSTAGPGRNRARNLLVASQLALGLVLLVGSGLMLRSFVELRAIDLGIEPEGVLTLGLNRNRGESAEVSARFFQDVSDRMAALPGVAAVGVTAALPLASGGANGGSFYIEGQPRAEDALPPVALYRAVGGDYFQALSITVLQGRTLERADWEEPRAVVWINESFAQTFFDGEALGERISWQSTDDGGDETAWVEIVGVVEDVREFGIRDDDLRPQAYFPMAESESANLEIQTMFLAIQVEDGLNPTTLTTVAERSVREFAPEVPITATRTMNDIVDEAMEATSATMIVLAAATIMALFLGAIGLAGVISYVVGQRTREIGVRVALGAAASDVSGMILKQSLVVTIAGTVLGLLGAFGLTRLMEALLFEVSTTDPVTFVVAPVVLVAVSLLATWLPVRRAARVDPMVALRAE